MLRAYFEPAKLTVFSGIRKLECRSQPSGSGIQYSSLGSGGRCQGLNRKVKDKELGYNVVPLTLWPGTPSGDQPAKLALILTTVGPVPQKPLSPFVRES
jgi:hypothetical protein